jgi:FkbM family methyltransferase
LAPSKRQLARLALVRWWGIFRSVFIYLNPVRQRSWQRFYSELLDSGDLAFDVGAHVGSRAKAMHKAGARVVAIEPQAQFTRFLNWSLPKDVPVIGAAVGRAVAEANLSLSSKNPTLASLKTDFVDNSKDAAGFEDVRWDGFQRVTVTTMDALIADHGLPRYLKIDVEGYELEVLQGLTKPVEIISFEYLPGFKDLTRKVLDRVRELGDYEFNAVIGEQAKFAFGTWRSEPEVRSWLDGLQADARSGDLFARLKTTS